MKTIEHPKPTTQPKQREKQEQQNETLVQGEDVHYIVAASNIVLSPSEKSTTGFWHLEAQLEFNFLLAGLFVCFFFGLQKLILNFLHYTYSFYING